MSYNDRFEPVEVEVEKVIAETDKAIGIIVDEDDEPTWIPKSQIADESEVQAKGDHGTMIIPRWLAEEKGLA